MLLLLVACTPPSSDSGAEARDTAAACDPGVPSLDVPDFHGAWDLQQVSVSPAEIDPATDLQPEDEHYVFVLADGPTRDELFVMLPGTDGRPANNTRLLTLAAESGYRAIGLAYPTETNQNDLCGHDEACAEGFTTEKLYGDDDTDVIAIDEPNSITGRLVRLLAALDERFPGSGWGEFLDAGAPAWSSLVLSGFSQGSGMAGWLAKDVAVARFVPISSGCDSVGTTPADARPADWCFAPRATPVERTFGILHTEDDFAVKRQVYEDAFELDELGAFADADAGSPDYCTHTHMLTTSQEPAVGADTDAYHKSLAVDDVMPVDADGVPLLAEDYWYLLAGG